MLREIFNKILFSLCFLTLSLFVRGQQLPEEHFLRGMAGYKQEMYDSALISFTLSKGLDEKNPYVWYYSGKTYFRKGNIREAIEDFLKAEERQTGIASFMLAKSYARQNNLEKSLHFLEIHLNSNYKKPESTILLDEDLNNFENRKEWIEFWRNSNHYSNFDKLLAEADYLISSKDYVEAIALLNNGIDMNYRESPLREKRAEVYALMNNDVSALRDLDKAIEKDRRNSSLYSKRGGVNYRLGNFRQSAEDFSSALKYDPASLELYPKMAKALVKINNYEEAKIKMEFYLDFFPRDAHALYEYGRIHMEAGKYLNALRSLNRALDLNKTESDYFLARGEAYYNSRTYEHASRDLSMALDLDPKNAEAYYIKGLTALKQGDREHACYCFKKAYRFGKKEAFNYLGDCR